MDDAKLIKELGGPTKLRERLGGAYSVQRIHNWSRRGIPPGVKLRHPEIFLAVLLRSPEKAAA